MEILFLIFLIWLISHAFPGSGQSYIHFGEVFAFIACAIVFLAIGAGLFYAAYFICLVTGIEYFPFVLMGLIASLMLGCGGINSLLDYRRRKQNELTVK